MENFRFEHPAFSGLTYEEFNKKSKEFIDVTDPNSLDELQTLRMGFKQLNQHRISRIHKTYKMSEQLKDAIKSIDSPQLWMMLTEDWCGDSAQNLPYIAMMSDENPLITLRILERDENPEVMDNYLTNGSRSIPKLVVFDESGNELFQWGPRPEEAANLVKELKAAGMSKEQFNEKLHLWYGRNRGKSVESEMLTLINSVVEDRSEVSID